MGHVYPLAPSVMVLMKQEMLLKVLIVVMGLMKVQILAVDKNILLIMVFVIVLMMNGLAKMVLAYLLISTVMVLMIQEIHYMVRIVLTDQMKVQIFAAKNGILLIWDIVSVEKMSGLVKMGNVYLLATYVMVLMRQGMLLMVLIVVMDLMKVQTVDVDKDILTIMGIVIVNKMSGHVKMDHVYLLVSAVMVLVKQGMLLMVLIALMDLMKILKFVVG